MYFIINHLLLAQSRESISALVDTHILRICYVCYTKHYEISLTVLYETFVNTYYDNCVLFKLNKEED